jgi:hypothetical protein
MVRPRELVGLEFGFALESAPHCYDCAPDKWHATDWSLNLRLGHYPSITLTDMERYQPCSIE